MDEILDDVPWYPTIEWLDQNKIDYVVGDEHAYENYAAVPFRPVREAGRFISMPREEGTRNPFIHSFLPSIPSKQVLDSAFDRLLTPFLHFWDVCRQEFQLEVF